MSRKISSSTSPRPVADPPPWEVERVPKTFKITSHAVDALVLVAKQTDIPEWYALDAILRGLTDVELAALVRRQRDLDGAARAAWARGR